MNKDTFHAPKCESFKKNFFLFVYLFGSARSQLQHVGSLVVTRGIKFPDQGSNLRPLLWEYRALTTRPPGKSLNHLCKRYFLCKFVGKLSMQIHPESQYFLMKVDKLIIILCLRKKGIESQQRKKRLFKKYFRNNWILIQKTLKLDRNTH